MSRMKRNYPTTVAALAADKDWNRRLLSLIGKYDIPEAPEDILQDIFAMMLFRKVDGLNYVERWDRAKGGSYSNWIYTFAGNCCKKKYVREHSKGGKALRYAATIVGETREEEIVPGQIPESRLPSPEAHREGFDMQADMIEAHLSKTRPHSWVIYREYGYEVHSLSAETTYSDSDIQTPTGLVGQRIDRNPATVFSLMRKGCVAGDIAQVMKTSVTFIYSLVKRLRADEQLLQWKDQVLV